MMVSRLHRSFERAPLLSLLPDIAATRSGLAGSPSACHTFPR